MLKILPGSLIATGDSDCFSNVTEIKAIHDTECRIHQITLDYIVTYYMGLDQPACVTQAVFHQKQSIDCWQKRIKYKSAAS